ncbi:hypothetical protein [Desulfosarcina ovata]|uniref:hypothetical protein n=1 Tax=Desulfosarcina ovata TaxID=83564 RepID=UPI0012D36633|nr:hypothetical protein [Desulfosarcina ovata]
MPVSASKVFDFLAQNAEINIVRHEITSTSFSMLRYSLRQIALKLHESDDHEPHEISRQLRVLLSKWLTVPVPFDRLIRETVTDLFGEVEAVQKRWGSDIRELYETALQAADDLTVKENPIRIKLREIIRELRSKGQKFRIYCHRMAQPHFHSLLLPPDDLPIENDVYLHTLRDYRETEPFDIMVKVGSLRSRGWGSAPDAILSAPRFSTFAQVVWSGCNDEADFGYDPVFSHINSSTGNGDLTSKGTQSGCCPVRRNIQIIRSGMDASTEAKLPADMDELHLFRELRQYRDKRPAILLQLSEEHGIFYPPYSRVLSYDPDERTHEPIAERIPGESLYEGMFIVMPLVDEIDFDGVKADHGHYSRAWKTKLKQEFQNDANGLIQKLRAEGLNLIHLRTALHHWCQPPSTVIHAPQHEKHFKILLKTIDFRGQDSICKQTQLERLWQAAWKEIRRSRGEAIQAGVQAQEIIAEELLETLIKFIPIIREKSSTDKSFILTIPDRYELHGTVMFFKVVSIEAGFRIPETDLKMIRELDEIDQWRD